MRVLKNMTNAGCGGWEFSTFCVLFFLSLGISSLMCATSDNKPAGEATLADAKVAAKADPNDPNAKEGVDPEKSTEAKERQDEEKTILQAKIDSDSTKNLPKEEENFPAKTPRIMPHIWGSDENGIPIKGAKAPDMYSKEDLDYIEKKYGLAERKEAEVRMASASKLTNTDEGVVKSHEMDPTQKKRK